MFKVLDLRKDEVWEVYNSTVGEEVKMLQHRVEIDGFPQDRFFSLTCNTEKKVLAELKKEFGVADAIQHTVTLGAQEEEVVVAAKVAEPKA